MQPPAQELVARDLHDYQWTFRHIFRGMFVLLFLSQSFHHRPFKSTCLNIQGSQSDTCSQLVGAYLLVVRGLLQEIQSYLLGNPYLSYQCSCVNISSLFGSSLYMFILWVPYV